MQVNQGKSVTSLCNKELLHIPILHLRGICRLTQDRYLLVKVFNVFSMLQVAFQIQSGSTPYMTIDVLCSPLVTLLTSSLHSCGRTPLLFRDSDEAHAPKCVGKGIRCCWSFNVFNIILFSVHLKNGEVLSEISGLFVALIFTSYSILPIASRQ